MKLAAQMYTLRDLVRSEQGLEECLQVIHGIGYPAVQLSGVACMDGDTPAVNAQRARDLLDENGLVACATHRPWERLRDQTDLEIAFHKTLGCSYVAIGGLWSGYDGVEGMRRFAEESKAVTARLADEGIKFGYHNHAHEFTPDPADGGVPYDVLIDAAPHLDLEIDVYWAAVAGLEPAELLKRAAGRISAIHFKDRTYSSSGVATYAAVGEGDLPWAEIISACRSGGTEWAIVEQDTCPRDPLDCLASSYDFLVDQV